MSDTQVLTLAASSWRKTETTVIRDAKGNISSATQIETDLE